MCLKIRYNLALIWEDKMGLFSETLCIMYRAKTAFSDYSVQPCNYVHANLTTDSASALAFARQSVMVCIPTSCRESITQWPVNLLSSSSQLHHITPVYWWEALQSSVWDCRSRAALLSAAGKHQTTSDHACSEWWVGGVLDFDGGLLDHVLDYRQPASSSLLASVIATIEEGTLRTLAFRDLAEF